MNNFQHLIDYQLQLDKNVRELEEKLDEEREALRQVRENIAAAEKDLYRIQTDNFEFNFQPQDEVEFSYTDRIYGVSEFWQPNQMKELRNRITKWLQDNGYETNEERVLPDTEDKQDSNSQL